jgi:hypothetical protein
MNIKNLTYEELLKNEKIFDAWNEQKKEIQREEDVEKFPKPREIFEMNKMEKKNLHDQYSFSKRFEVSIFVLL